MALTRGPCIRRKALWLGFVVSVFWSLASVCPVSCLFVVAVLACSSYGLGGCSVPTRAPGGVQDPWLGRNCLLTAASSVVVFVCVWLCAFVCLCLAPGRGSLRTYSLWMRSWDPFAGCQRCSCRPCGWLPLLASNALLDRWSASHYPPQIRISQLSFLIFRLQMLQITFVQTLSRVFWLQTKKNNARFLSHSPARCAPVVFLGSHGLMGISRGLLGIWSDPESIHQNRPGTPPPDIPGWSPGSHPG